MAITRHLWAVRPRESGDPDWISAPVLAKAGMRGNAVGVARSEQDIAGCNYCPFAIVGNFTPS